ncbi:MAG: glycosyltransferase family 4 protein [Gemmatimonadales bacterium]
MSSAIPEMRVALMIGAIGWRGSAASFAKITRGLLERGHQSLLLTGAPRLTARFQEEGLPVTQVPAGNTGPREVWAVNRALRRLGAQAIIVDTPRDLRLAAYATIPLRTAVVYRYNLNYRPARGHLADRMYARRVSLLVFQSRFIREDAYRQSPWLRRIPQVQIPNGYDTDRYRPDPEAGLAFRAAHRIGPDRFVVVTPGKLARNKGHDVAFHALAGVVARERLPITYVVLGDGVREAELRAMADRLSVPTIFTGLLTPVEVAAALNAADLVVHPSPQEIFPNAVGEAMSCARPVLAVDAGGTGELVGRDGAGLLVPPGDPEALAAAVTALFHDPGRRESLGAGGRRRIEAEFPLSRMIDGYEAALAGALLARG